MASIKQHILRALYPVLMKATGNTSGKGVLVNSEGKLFQKPIYNLAVELNNGRLLPLHELNGRKMLFVNTASNCGYTAQYSELQQLHERYGTTVQTIGFPANDFKEQEPDGDDAIAQFCQVNYGVTFPIAKKSSVLKGPEQNSVYQWLTHKEQNGWNDKAPSWNFSKYLLNEHGVLTHYFEPSVSPLSNDILQAINT